ncbi:trehalose 6-phosphate phosphorylase [Desulfuromonas soudanensis]|uniref:Trehalose 6-phosphate phosphorylase n=1 Tax=Desulfuromonas soudanensis TaxID=1603606 RepID=A0A0M4CWR9_9BACT|nr:glycosyl hydrolase family 65 protein [Desulfuromonas soudanensis]ALC16504.1 trehalose 6-phosphate phosphorylase [Desulfuromonas soudanensis]
MNGWSLIYENYEPEKEGLREALCTLGNGYFCTRGAAPEAAADGVHYPGTYLAGGYNRLTTQIAGRTIENEDLVNFPNWLPLSFRIEEGPWFELERVKILSFRQELDLECGLLQRTVRFQDSEQRISRLRQRRMVHMCNRHLAALETTLTAENWSGRVEFRSALDGRIKNGNVERYRDLANEHLQAISTGQPSQETIFLKIRTSQSRIEMALAARTLIFSEEREQSPERHLEESQGYVGQTFELNLPRSGSVRIEKVVSLFTSRDEAISECGLEAINAISRAPGFENLLEHHRRAWAHLWRRYGLDIRETDGSERVRMILRLHIFHLLQTVSFHTIELDVGVPARGWHGEAYRGHVFWDELFIFPLLNLRTPEITRTLLHYRHRRLPEARSAARQAGYRGALYPWQSGSNGREESQDVHLNPRSGRWIPDNSHLQRHVNAAIAWNVWHYYQVTGDAEFISFYGAEMILEIARFCAGLTTWNENLGRYEILGVMGPDEYHDSYPGSDRPGLDNNAYTNVMVVWILTCALEMLNILSGERLLELKETLELSNEEMENWEDISHRMRLVFHDDNILSQFEGYDKLEELDWKTYRARHGRVMRLDRILEAEKDTPNRYKCSKQADVLMLFYLFSSDELASIFERLGYPFEYETIPRNIAYYLERTSHGSTLSQVVHSWVLSRSDREGSWQLFTEALSSDIDDIQGGTTHEGIHLGAMAGTVDLMQRGYVGIETRGDQLRFNPCLPRELRRLQMRLRYRGLSLELEVTPRRLSVTCVQCGCEPIKIRCRNDEATITGGQTLVWNLTQE